MCDFQMREVFYIVISTSFLDVKESTCCLPSKLQMTSVFHSVYPPKRKLAPRELHCH